MKKSGVNKSAAIRDYAAANQSAKPREIAEALTAKGISVTSHTVSQVLYTAKKQGGGNRRGAKKKTARGTAAGAGRRSVQTVDDGSLDLLFEAKRLADMVGGVERAKKVLDQLAKLRD